MWIGTGERLNKYNGQLNLLIEDIEERKEKKYKTVILAGTRPRGERLVKTLMEKGISSTYKDSIDKIEAGEVVITFGNLIRGFDYPELELSIISDKDIFGETRRKHSGKAVKRKGVAKITSFAELKPGDYVVHANHGIGIYKGIKQMVAGGTTRDYLDIVYDKGDKLYVPVDQLDLVQKYIGSEGNSPKINKLGGAEWQKAKAKARKSINEIAQDLVKLYAARATLKGHSFGKDTEWQRQFEDEFPYEETPDQLASLEEIKSDMESDKPMDRLLCGDVGYGKTEVAIRAAFKAVMDGKQVAFLVPTTILAEQHYNNFIKRFSDFPIKIDMISRFRTPKQQKATLQALKEGNVDILIGTHRLVSKDIVFKDLGLLVVDEEQRFGVSQKEKIKGMKKMKMTAFLLSGAILLGSCGTMNNTTKGGIIGGGSGAAAGAIIGGLFGKGKGAAIGAAVGAAVGTGAGVAIGHKMDKKAAEAAKIEGAQVEMVKDANNLDAVKVTFDSGILFAFNSSTLSNDAKASLRDLAKILKEDTTTDIAIIGHTDKVGTYEANMKVSKNRAYAVENYLQDCGVSPSQFKQVEGVGYNEYDESLSASENRRVVIFMYASEQMIKNAEAGK